MKEREHSGWTWLGVALVALIAAAMVFGSMAVDLNFDGMPVAYRDFKIEWSTNLNAWNWYADIHATNRSDKLKVTVDSWTTNSDGVAECWRVREVGSL